VPGAIVHESSYPGPGEFYPDSQDSSRTTYPGDIPQHRPVSGPIFSSLQLFLLSTRVSLTAKFHLEQSDTDSLDARTRGAGW